MNRTINDESLAKSAKQLGTDVAALRAVAEVESAGGGFLPAPSVAPKILFEGHVFHRLTQGKFDVSHPGVSFPKWGRSKYSGSLQGEWERLDLAATLDRTAALQSASWGAFQIMGFHYAACGYDSIDAFVEGQKDGAQQQLLAFSRFIARAPYIEALRKHDWVTFAAAYNGSGYRANRYDVKLRDAYRRFSGGEKESTSTAKPARRSVDAKAKNRLSSSSNVAGPSGLSPGRASFGPLSPVRAELRRRPVRPDSVDVRDWLYRPSIAVAPLAAMFPGKPCSTKDQQHSNACTGFGLATVIEYLLARAKRPVEQLSGYMLYSMARRYDEWSDNDDSDDGSSLRGALKGWAGHGASLAKLWKTKDMPRATNDSKTDWWLDAVTRPLGAYYRMEPNSIGDIHIALVEAGVVYASARIHDGWDALSQPHATDTPTAVEQLPTIEPSEGDSGHAFAIVGYTHKGFIIQNSWGSAWGRGGFAVLPYNDWLVNAMDCWVVQLGVVTTEHVAVSKSSTLRPEASGAAVTLAANPTLADHQIGPFVVDMENNGELSRRGRFRTSPDDLVQLLDYHLVEACKEWQIKRSGVVDVAIYAHGGLANEEAAASVARTWIPLLRSNRIFPIFLMWETGALKTLRNIFSDVLSTPDDAAGGSARDRWRRLKERAEEWKDERVEGMVRWPGGKLWDEMKENADRLSNSRHSGVVQLFDLFQQRREKLPRVRLHLVGHSAGAIAHCHIGARAARMRLPIDSLSFIAPASTIELFDRKLGGLISAKAIRTLIVHLTDAAERADQTCRPYGRSLLYLISRALERGHNTPVLGMERFLVPAVVTGGWGSKVTRLVSPGGADIEGSSATSGATHGGLDEDAAVQAAVIRHIRALKHAPRILQPVA